MKKLRKNSVGYTLIELLIAVSLSLLLLLGVTEMFRHVGSTMSDTQKSLNMSANLNATAMTLRDDLSKINPMLARKPNALLANDPDAVTDSGEYEGYLEIVEGMNAPYSVVINNNNGLHLPITNVAVNSENNTYDQTVGDVDDILAFTAEADSADYKFRGLINGGMNESEYAEIIWFVRGTTLYRRVLLIDEHNNCNTAATPFYATNDVSVRNNGGIVANQMSDLSRRENRFTHSNGTFPYPLYGSASANEWYFLRMPTLEEAVHSTWLVGQSLPSFPITPTPPTPPNTPYWDFWENPNGLSGGTWQQDTASGSISSYVTSPRHSRAGEDIVLKNVISFDVKVWNPYWVPCAEAREPLPNTNSNAAWMWAPPQYVDLGQDRFILKNPNNEDQECFVNYYQNMNSAPVGIPANRGFGFCSKGRYSGLGGMPTTVNDSLLATAIDYTSHSSTPGQWTGTPLFCVFDSWTTHYERNTTTTRANVGLTVNNDPGGVRTGAGVDSINFPVSPVFNSADNWECPPPYTEDLKSIQITIRCFEPQSGHIKQIRVV
ncbi:MAG: prepilin-type N-terminal cleavage/methylation domain-containing protein, partial [Planctomycetaceae bacterium]|nr:prepilin-type N-terminal cleavage/methylation domain-containing protein [Planctomycetaceae bacterium]